MEVMGTKKKRYHHVPVALCLCLVLCGFGSDSFGSDKDIKNQMRKGYIQLLMEKGICDDRGAEIEDRMDRLISSARGKGLKRDRDIVNDILGQLNYSRTNLGNFPSCAFDRPIGHKLTEFGHTKADSNIDATAEASACPVGGIGSGAFERTISGNFRYWFLKLGWMMDDTVWASQFHVYMKKSDNTIVKTLSTDAPPSERLRSWNWSYPEGKGTYYALFPKSGFSYETNSDFPVRLAVTQYSPVIPHNYHETSYPVGVFKWIAENPSNEPVEVSVMLTWQNMVGWQARTKTLAIPTGFDWDRNSTGNFNEFVQDSTKTGIVFRKQDMDLRSGNDMLGSMCIAAEEIPGQVSVYYQTDFDPLGAGLEVWQPFSKDGSLLNSQNSRTVGKKEAAAGAIAVKMMLEPGERKEFPIVVAWDFPYAEFEKGVKYRKKYTEYFDTSGENAFAIACEALDKYQEWEKTIDDWQNTIIQDASLPDWFKQVLFNELYILAETSLWDASTNLHTYLESIDYLMYGTFDVDAYSSWHLLGLWPELELGNMLFFAKTVDWEDPTYKRYLYPDAMPGEVPEDKMHYYWNTNKVFGMIPHDIGSPRLRPWTVLNAFDWQNGNVWKDLNPKFPLRAYRDFLYSKEKDYDFLRKMFRTSVIALDTLEKRFGDRESHIPLNEGIPDQTYDTWKMKGESAFVSILWLAALKTTMNMGQDLINMGISEVDLINIQKTIHKYRDWFEKGKIALQGLWNEEGGYFNIDATMDDIMADQLFGLWYTKILGLEDGGNERIISLEQAKKSLQTVYEKNVLGFGGGLMGAVNGRGAQGQQLFSQQGDEVWVGTTFAFASNCILHGMIEEGMHATYGVFHMVYSPYGQGYFFKTPEAYNDPEEGVWNNPDERYGEKLFRAMKYMRPGAIWAVHEALTQMKNKK
ncbi:MAG: GH116 family glycosyl hydrolase [Candidatus Aminicenantes bacterium]|jgi:non-lysosomal glucosylceramidase